MKGMNLKDTQEYLAFTYVILCVLCFYVFKLFFYSLEMYFTFYIFNFTLPA